MRTFYKLSLTIAVGAALTAGAHAAINYTGGTYTQNFDSMGALGTTTPTDWFVGSGTGPAVTGTTVIPDTGSSNTPGNYNYGVSGVHGIDERALGSRTSQGVQLDTEVAFKNGTGASLTQFTLTYDGEQWKPSFFADTLTLQLSTNGITWTALGSAFNFVSPIVNSGSGALDGNAAANRVANIGGTFNLGTPVAPGGVLFFRFADPDNAKTDAGLSVDNFTFGAVPEPSAYMLLGIGILLCGQRFLRRGLAQTFRGAGLRHSATRALLCALLLGFAFASKTQAQWLTHTYTSNNPPTSQGTTAFFPNGAGAYSGNVTVTASNFVDGTGDGYAGIVPSSFSGPLTPTFNSNFPYNPGNTFDFLTMGSTDTGDTFDVKFDFSGLGGTNQYLPAFTTIALLDVDSLERIGSLTAYDPLGNIITGQWLQPLAPPRDLFDWAGGGIVPGHEATYTQTGGIYTFTATATNDSSAFQGFATQFDIGSIQFHYDHNQAIFGDAPGGYGIAILAPVPEPSATVLTGVGGFVAFILVRRRGRARGMSMKIAPRA